MPEKVSVTFVQEMNSWEGVYRIGSTYLCDKAIAERLCASGYVKFTEPTAAAVEVVPVAQPVSKSRKLIKP